LDDRVSVVFLEHGTLAVDNHCFVLRQRDRELIIPVACACVLALQPGVCVTHEAVVLAAREKTLLLFVGEQGTRLYASTWGEGSARSSDRILRQATNHANPVLRLRVATAFHCLMTGESPKVRDIETLRGIEGAWVAKRYRELYAMYGVDARSRSELSGQVRLLLNHASACLYGLVEVAVLAAGYNPSIGFVHTGHARSLVYDLADTIKFATVVPLALQLRNSDLPPSTVGRRACRDLFAREQTLRTLFLHLETAMKSVA